MKIELENKLLNKYEFLNPVVLGYSLEENTELIKLMARGIDLKDLKNSKETLGKIEFEQKSKFINSILPCNIGCDDGWYGLLDETFNEIKKYLDNANGKTNNKYAEYYKELINNGDNKTFSNKAYYEKVYADLIDKPDKILILATNISDVRQKLGGLDIRTRPDNYDFYASKYHFKGWCDEHIIKIIANAERKSMKICEVCGKEGGLAENSSGWLKTLCNKHEKDLGFEKLVMKQKLK